MKYTKQSLVGDMGEHFFAYKIFDLFGWPCRLYGIDIGIDAEIEVLDADRRSIGKIIKVQVKSTNVAGSKNELALDARHVRYWNNLSIPLIVCWVDLKRKKIFWKQVTKEFQSKDKKPHKIRFTDRDLLQRSSKQALQELINSGILENIEQLIGFISEGVEYITEGLSRYEESGNFDIIDAQNVKSEFDYIIKVIGEANTVFVNLPKGSILKIIQKYDELVSRVEELQSEFSYIEDIILQDYGDEAFSRFSFTYRDLERLARYYSLIGEDTD
jgi:hypothetical protein